MLIRHEPLPDHLPSQPRSAGILSCQSNLMALSWHMPISARPFRYAIAMRKENMTHSLLEKHGSFVLNFLPFSCYEQIDQCGRVHGSERDKLSYTGLTAQNTDSLGNIILDASDYAYECRIIDTYVNGDHTIFIADVNALHLNEQFDGHSVLFLGKGIYATPSAITQANRKTL